MILLTSLLIVSLAFVGLTFFLLTKSASNEQQWIQAATTVQVSSQQFSKAAGEAAAGNLDAFTELASARTRISNAMNQLENGSPENDLPASPGATALTRAPVSITWKQMNANSLAILERKDLILEIASANVSFAKIIPQVLQNTDQMLQQLTKSGAPTQQVYIAGRQLVLADRMLRRVSEVLQGGSGAIAAAENLGRELKSFDQVLSALLNGNQGLGVTRVSNTQALSSLGETRKLFDQARPHIQTILDSSAVLFELRGAADEILLDSRDIFDKAATLNETIADLPTTRVWPSNRAGGIGLAVLLTTAVLLLGMFISSERRRAKHAALQNQRNEQAIMRLLTEMSSLADGDLTVQASVTEDVTGAIADSVNYAVEQLRELVMGINYTAQQVADSAQVTRTETSQLATASGKQAKQVSASTDTIRKMANSFSQMARRSAKSSEVAQHSVDIAHNGAEMVRETIKGMDTIREQIQETSKRIKRLGESSQEIGDIVSLINGIAEQTNVLALNAAIQAASAGGAGKGFAVVADEVQQLAESATKATRRIGTIVQTIQTDTSEAVESMEATTSEVVHGAGLAEDAGEALERIETVSKDLSGLIQDISSEAQTQSQTATRISELMHNIRDVSILTSEGSARTATAVENLAELVIKLSDSVADFKLPEED
jgi:twitching motility protein PilJ